MKPRILILGWGRAGKDESARFLNDHCGLPYAGSTSWAALPLMAEALKTHPQLAWEHRHEHRQLWKDTCDRFRERNPMLLIQLALHNTPNAQVFTGARDRLEILAAKSQKFFQHYLWIERPGVPPDPTVTFSPADCTDFVLNDGSLERFHQKLVVWAVTDARLVTPDQLDSYAVKLLNLPRP